MTAKKHTTHRTCKSDLTRVDAYKICPHEYDEVPELIDEDFSKGAFKRAGRPVAADPRKQASTGSSIRP